MENDGHDVAFFLALALPPPPTLTEKKRSPLTKEEVSRWEAVDTAETSVIRQGKSYVFDVARLHRAYTRKTFEERGWRTKW